MRKAQAWMGTLLLTGLLSACTGAMPGFSAPDSLTLSAKVGSSVTQGVMVTNTGETTLDYVVSSDSSWLTIPSGNRGSIPVGAVVTVNAQAACVAAGSNTGHLTVSAAGMVKTVTVLLTCAAIDTTPGPMQVSATTLGFNGTSGNQTVNITKANYTGALTQTNTCSGIASVSTSGSTGPAVTMTVTPSAAGTCAITVTSGEGESASVNVTVTATSIIIN